VRSVCLPVGISLATSARRKEYEYFLVNSVPILCNRGLMHGEVLYKTAFRDVTPSTAAEGLSLLHYSCFLGLLFNPEDGGSISLRYIDLLLPIFRTTGFSDFVQSSGILQSRKHNVSETGSLSVLRWGGWRHSVLSLRRNWPQSLSISDF
jgi:hypothetical protein